MQANTIYINVNKNKNKTLEQIEYIENNFLNSYAKRVLKRIKKLGVSKCLVHSGFKILIIP